MPTKTKTPKSKPVVHLPFIEYQQYVREKYNPPQKRVILEGSSKELSYYYVCVVDHHMFRGNDSSMCFFNQFLEEVIDEELRPAFEGISEKILELIFTSSGATKKTNEAILSIPEKEWIKAYIHLIDNAEGIIQKLGKENEYYFGYMMSSLFESAAMSHFKIKDYYKNSYRHYYWHFSW